MPWSPARFEQIFAALDEVFPKNITFLEFSTPFQLVIAVILSARTTDNQVNRVTGELFARYPGPADLAAADRSEVENILRPIGFYRQKSGHIIQTAVALAARAVPDDMDELLKLPGVGRKTANVILGAVFGRPAVIVDTHFARVVHRLGWSGARTPAAMELELKALIPPAKQYRTSMMLNLLGRRFCRPRRPDCPACPVSRWCPSSAGPGR